MSRVLYRDGLILVFNKPEGLAVHKAGPCLHNLEQYFPLLTYGLTTLPMLAHRLDRGTSGCLVLARNLKAARTMQKLFLEGRIEKTYFAWVHGVILNDSGRIDVALRRASREKSNWRMMADPEGNFSAVTDYSVVARCTDRTLLKLQPKTGRTHQLRVHCKALGHPIIGDTVYGFRDDHRSPLHLHARHIEIPLYKKKPPLKVSAWWPPHMQYPDIDENTFSSMI